uniref:Uncharacterized protein n=2 Tax=Picea TaxID=3328 RepID=A0A101LZ71_PICGL|nr:hypothetical protein ABT39_MTgene5070 [Picea glauca]QHR89742.1 hypothetical protein Q903MT_gene3764 [Picea sitchensis]
MLRLSPLPLAFTLLDQQALQLPLALYRSLSAHFLISYCCYASLGRVRVSGR